MVGLYSQQKENFVNLFVENYMKSEKRLQKLLILENLDSVMNYSLPRNLVNIHIMFTFSVQGSFDEEIWMNLPASIRILKNH